VGSSFSGTGENKNVITLVQTEIDQPDSKIAVYMLLLDAKIAKKYSDNICTRADEQKILDSYEILWDKSTPVKYLPGVKLNNFYQNPDQEIINRNRMSVETVNNPQDYLADISINPSNLLGLNKYLKNSDQKESNLLKTLNSKNKKFSRFSELDTFLKSKKETIDHLRSVNIPELSRVLTKWHETPLETTKNTDANENPSQNPNENHAFSLKFSGYCNYTKTDVQGGTGALNLNVVDGGRVLVEHTYNKNTRLPVKIGSSEMNEWELIVGLHCEDNLERLGGFLDPTSFEWSYT